MSFILAVPERYRVDDESGSSYSLGSLHLHRVTVRQSALGGFARTTLACKCVYADFATVYLYRDLPEVQALYADRVAHDDVIELLLVAIDNDDPGLFQEAFQRGIIERPFIPYSQEESWIADIVHVALNTPGTERLLDWLLKTANLRQQDYSLSELWRVVQNHVMLDRCLVQRYRNQEPQRGELEHILIRSLTVTQSEIVERGRQYIEHLEQDDPQSRTSIRGPFHWLSSFLSLSDLARPDLQRTLPPRARIDPEQRQVYQEFYDRIYTLLYQKRDRGFDEIACLTNGVGLVGNEEYNDLVSIWHRRLFSPDDYRLALQILRDPLSYEDVARAIAGNEFDFRDYLRFIDHQIDDPEAWVAAFIRFDRSQALHRSRSLRAEVEILQRQGRMQLANRLETLADLLTQAFRRPISQQPASGRVGG